MLLSFCIFVRNDEECIGGLLENVVGVADEIVIVDIGSTDRTMEICRKFDSTVNRPFETFRTYEAGFTTLGNIQTLTTHLARGEWVLTLQAHERIDILDLYKIRQLCETSPPNAAAYSFPKKYWLDLNQKISRPHEDVTKVQLFRNSVNYWFSSESRTILRGLFTIPAITHVPDLFVHDFEDAFPNRVKERDTLLQLSQAWSMKNGESFWDKQRSKPPGTKAPSISFCMIIKNEEHCIEHLMQRLIDSDILNEIVILDTGSTDNTVEICRKYANRIYQVEFSNFSSMKTLAAHLTRGEWVLMIDADENMDLNDLRKLPEFCNNKDGKVAFRFPRKRWLDLEMKNQTELEAYPDYQLRFFKNQTTTFFIGIIDECVRGLYIGTDKDIDPENGPFLHHFQDVFHTPEYWQQRRDQRLSLANKYREIMSEHIFSKEIEDIKKDLGIETKSWATKG